MPGIIKMLIRLLFGLLLIAGGAYPWWRLNGGMNVWSFHQWMTVIGGTIADPSIYWQTGVLVGWALMLPGIGIIVLLSALLGGGSSSAVADVHTPDLRSARRPNPLLTQKPSSNDESRISDAARMVTQQTSEEIEDARPAAEPAKRKETKTPAIAVAKGPSRLGRLFSLVRKSTTTATALVAEKIKAPRVAPTITEPSNTVSIASRIRAASDAIGSRMPAFSRKGRKGASSTTGPSTTAPTIGAEPVAERVIKWYDEWQKGGAVNRPVRLIEEAVALSKVFTTRDANELTGQYSMRGISAQNALFAAVEHYEGARAPRDEKSIIATAMDQPSFEELRDDDLTPVLDITFSDSPARQDRAAAPTTRPPAFATPKTRDTTSPFGDIEEELGDDDFVERPRNSAAPEAKHNDHAEHTSEFDEEFGSPDSAGDEGGDVPISNPSILHPSRDNFGFDSIPNEAPRRTAETSPYDEDHSSHVSDDDGAVDPAIVDIEDDIEEGRDQELYVDEQTLKLLGTVIRKDGSSVKIKDLNEEDERSSTQISNDQMDATIRTISAERLRRLVGGKAAAAPQDVASDAAGGEMDHFKARSDCVPALWHILETAVQYQTKAFAWGQS
jgi:hypothetical protein